MCWSSITSRLAKVAIKSKARIVFIDPAEVSTVEAKGNYVLLQQRSGSYLPRESIWWFLKTGALWLRANSPVDPRKPAFAEEIQPGAQGDTF